MFRKARRPARPRILAGFFGALAFLLVGMSGALAHASLAAVDPSDGAVVEAAPSAIALTFSEIVSPLFLRLVAPDGSTRDLEEIAFDGNTLRAALPAELSDGTHVVSWRVVSEDGHPVGG